MPPRKRQRERRYVAEIEAELKLAPHILSSARVFTDGSALYQNDDLDLRMMVLPPRPGKYEIQSKEYSNLPTADTLNAAVNYVRDLINDVLGPGDYIIDVLDPKGRRTYRESSLEYYDPDFHADHFSHLTEPRDDEPEQEVFDDDDDDASTEPADDDEDEDEEQAGDEDA